MEGLRGENLVENHEKVMLKDFRQRWDNSVKDVPGNSTNQGRGGGGNWGNGGNGGGVVKVTFSEFSGSVSIE